MAPNEKEEKDMSKKELSRRDFLRGTAAGALGLAAAGVLSACGDNSKPTPTPENSPEAPKGSYTPGTYSATVKGYASFITVTMTFSADTITACEVNAAGETPDIGDKAAQELAGLIVKDQNVDAVTTATAAITLPAVRKAAKNCIDQAQGAAVALNENAGNDGDDWLGEAPEIGDDQIAETKTTDLLIIGAGSGGLMAAVTAADAGMDFILCEQNTVVGDTRGWIGAYGTRAQKEAGVEVQKDRLLNEIARYASYKCNMDVIKMWIDHSAEMVSYLEELGMVTSVHIAPTSHVGGSNMEYYVPSIWHSAAPGPALPEEQGSPMWNRNAFLEKYINKKGYEIAYNTSLVRLVQNGSGAVTGAIFTNADGKYVKITAKNTILATGGYPGNPKMVLALAPRINECVTANSYFAPDTGMGIKAGLWAGAKMDAESAPMIFDRGIVPPGVKAGYVDDGNGGLKFPGPMAQFIIGTQPYLKVNKEGHRFANESCPYDFFNHTASLQTDGVYASIVDANVTEDIIAYDQYGCAQIAVNIAQGNGIIPMLEGSIEQGLVFKADTIEELAGKMDIPADALKATVDRYNELSAKGVDEDYGKEAYRLRPVAQAPFYGFFMGGSLLTTCDGLQINRKCQVYDTEHKVIEGLYCVGDCSGSFFSGNYPEYFVGVAVGRTMTQGRWAVKGILGEEV